MEAIFMNPNNSRRSDFHRLLLNLADKINLKTSSKYVASSNLNIFYAWKNIKKSWKIINLRCQLWHETKVWIIWWIIFCIRYSRIFWVYIKKCGEKTGNKTGGKTDNSSIMIHISKIENIIMFKIKTGYCLELLMTETMKFLGITKSKDEPRVLYTFVLHKLFGQLLDT